MSSKVSIPSNLRKTIQHIKEITGSHSEEEIYAMLKECSMDPNETAQKLLLQDTFHEVKRKRDRRKENSSKEATDSRRQPGQQGRGSKGNRYMPRHVSQDAGDGRGTAALKENGINPTAEKSATSLQPVSHGTKNEQTMASSMANLTTDQIKVSPSSNNDNNKLVSVLPAVDSNENVVPKSGTLDPLEQNIPTSSKISATVTPTSSSVCSSSDPVLVPSGDLRPSNVVGAIKREVGNYRASVEPNVRSKSNVTAASEIRASLDHGKMSMKSQEIEKNRAIEPSHHSFASQHGGSSASRPPSNYSNRSQQIAGSQKGGGLSKEWKPKPTSSGAVQRTETAASVEKNSLANLSAPSQPVSTLPDAQAASELQKNLENLHLPQRQPVILPNHIHVPESERFRFSFGSFEASFGMVVNSVGDPESVKSSIVASETSQAVEETSVQFSSNQNALETTTEEEDYSSNLQSPKHASENISPDEGDAPSNVAIEYKESSQDASLLPGGLQSMAHATSNYSFGFVPTTVGSQTENSESQQRDFSRIPSFVIQQPFDPMSYYAQFYRSGVDSDGRISPFTSPGVPPKYNGSVGVLPQQSSSQEGGNSLVLSAGGPTPLVTQAAGLMQSSIAMTQQPLPVFRPPTGVHVSPYPPNFIPYGHYFSPFYVPPTIPQFLSNGAYPQQPQAAGLFPTPPTAAAPGVKYPLPQYKTGGNTGNSTHVGIPGYGPYGLSQTGYNSSSAAAGGHSMANEDLSISQFKENNVYLSGQQNEGSRVWIAAPGRDMSSLPTSSFYNLPPQGQHAAFAPTQTWQFGQYLPPGSSNDSSNRMPTSTGIADVAGAVDMVAPSASMYQQPQHAPIAWPNSY